MIQWYPGHMAKSRRILERDLKIVDLVVEVLDARIPYSSQNPDLAELLGSKKKIIVLNKMDLADRAISERWKNYFARDYPVVLVNSLTGEGIKELLAFIEAEGREINKALQEKGRNKRDIRIMVVGIPNVGKSALINVLAGVKYARTGNKPGVTRGRQWITVRKDIQLLDTPGILWPKFDDEDVGYRLALTGAIRDEVFDEEAAACKLIEYITGIDETILEKAYDIVLEAGQEIPYDILVKVGQRTGCLMSGGRIDMGWAASRLINDFRRGKLGSISLEVPGDDI